MFIQLTRLDGRRIWFNTRYMVTVEQRKGPGAIVVPLGDDLDYEVRESPEKVVSLCDGTPMPAHVEPPPPEPPKYKINLPFAKTVKVVSPNAPESKPADAPKAETAPKAENPSEPAPVPQTAEVPQIQTAEPPAADAPAASEVPAPPAEPPAAEAPAAPEESAQKPARKTAAKKTAATKGRGGRKPKLELDEAQITRLKSMKPGSEKKLVNTLNAQFGVSDVAKTVKALVAHGHMELSDQGHIDWK